METQKKIKIETFKELKRHLKWIGVLRANSSAKENRLCLIKNCVVLSTLVSSFLTSAWFRAFSAQSIREISESSFIALGSLLYTAWYSTLIWKRKEYADMFDELDAEIEQRTSDPSVETNYHKISQNIEFVTKNLFLMIYVLATVYSMIPIVASIFKYITSEYSNESFQLIFPATYPFNEKTPFGYTACILIQIATFTVAAECYVAPVTMTAGFCLFITDFASDLRVKLRQINDDVVEQQDKNWTATEEIWLRKKLVEFVQFHSDAREFAIRFSDENQAIVFACPAFTIAVFGTLILKLKFIFGSGDFIEIFRSSVMIFVSLFPFALFCHFGGNITHQFENLGKDVYQLEWYKLPKEMQKQLPIIIASTQKRIYMRGYGDTRSTHSVLKRILKNKFFFFILARKL